MRKQQSYEYKYILTTEAISTSAPHRYAPVYYARDN